MLFIIKKEKANGHYEKITKRGGATPQGLIGLTFGRAIAWNSLSDLFSKSLDYKFKANYNSNMKKYSCGVKGFTLAEVLITLAIIGVVAALTIPTIISKIQEVHFHAKWKDCYALLNSAFRMTVAENPGMVVSQINSYGPTREFIDAMLLHLNVVDTCSIESTYDSNICDNSPNNRDEQIKYKWSGIASNYPSSRYTTFTGGKITGGDFNQKTALLKNGASIYFGGLWSGLTIVVDVNNFNGGPNILGKDVYAISLTGTSVNYNKAQYIESLFFKPYGAEGTQTEINGYQGCDAAIGASPDGNGYVNYLGRAPGAGCSYKYLYEK